MANISPGVYTKIIDLSTYVQEIPSSTGLICFLSKQGEDNKIKFLGSREELVSEFGNPNINDYGKNYSQGKYIAFNFLGDSGSLYVIRCMPDNATYSNLRIDATMASNDLNAALSMTYLQTQNSLKELQTNNVNTGNVYPICLFYPIGRGDYYNQLGMTIIEHSNPMYSGIYTLNIYQKQSDGDEVIVESFDISFDQTAVDSGGESMYIEYVLAQYSSLLRCYIGDDGYDLCIKNFDKEIGTVSGSKTSGSAYISDTKQNFSDWSSLETGYADYLVIAKDGKGKKIYGWLGADSTGDHTSINVFDSRNLATANQAWLNYGDSTSNLTRFDFSSTVTYQIKKSLVNIGDLFTSGSPIPLRFGSDGDLLNVDGSVNYDTCKQVLVQAYNGTLFNPEYTDLTQDGEVDGVLDLEDYMIDLVFDAGYPSDVKDAISSLANIRRDCMAILDNGDNANYTAAINSRDDDNTFNTYLTALYEGYTKVYDEFSGQDVWFSPIYHMAYLLPRNDRVAELWYAAAGFNRGVVENVKELRYNPKLGQRDQLYLNQLNPIVKFGGMGVTVWGQLTSQAKSSALSDVNIVRLVLYVSRMLSRACKFYVWEQNDAITWSKISGDITEALEQIKIKRGLDSYSVSVGATAIEKKQKKIHCDIILQPTRVVEQINLNFFIE